MFGMSLGEIFVIAIIAILFIGPDKLPETMVKIAKFFKNIKKTIHETKESIEQEIHLSELKEEAISYKKELNDIVNEYKNDSDFNIKDDLKNELVEIEDSFNTYEEPKPNFKPLEVEEEITKSKDKDKKKKKKKKKKKSLKEDSKDV